MPGNRRGKLFLTPVCPRGKCIDGKLNNNQNIY